METVLWKKIKAIPYNVFKGKNKSKPIVLLLYIYSGFNKLTRFKGKSLPQMQK